MDLKRLQHFALLGEELHFSHAAERANLSPTAFSRSIQFLESDLNLRLFDRGTRTVELTAAGRQLLGRAKDLLNAASNLKAEAGYIATAEGGDLRFGAGAMTVAQYLHQTLANLRRESPKLRLELEISHWQNLSQLLLEDRIEFFIANADALMNDPRFDVYPLPAEPASIFSGSHHPLARQKDLISTQQLLEYPWAFAHFGGAVASHLRRLFKLPSNTPLPLNLNCNDLPLLRALVLDSDSLLFTWRAWLKTDLDNSVFIDLASRIGPALPCHLLYLNCAIVRLAGRTLSPAAQRVVELLQIQGEKRREELACWR